MKTPYNLRTWVGLGVLCLSAGVMVLNMASLSPLLRAIGQEFGISDAATGQVASLGSLCGVAAALAATPWMDRWSRRTWLRLLGSLVLIAVLISALAPTFEWFLFGRVLAAASGSVIMANAMTGARELFHDSVWRNRAIGIIVSATTLAFTVGLPVITQIEARWGWRIALGSLAVLVAPVLAGSVTLPAKPMAHPGHGTKSNPLASFQGVLGDGRTRGLLIVLGLNVGTYTGWLVFFGAYVTDVFAASAGVLSALFFFSGATELFINNLTPPLLRRFDSIRVLYASLGVVSAALLLTGILITAIPGAFVAAVVILNGTAVAYIAASALLLTDNVARPGATMALASATIGVGNALGPAVTGWALAASGSFEAAYRVLGLLAPVAIVALWFGTRRHVPAPAAERV